MKAKVGDWLVMKGFTIDKPEQRGLITRGALGGRFASVRSAMARQRPRSDRVPGPDAIVVTAAEQQAADERAKRRIASVQSGIAHHLKSE